MKVSAHLMNTDILLSFIGNGNYKCNLSHKYGIDSEFEFSISSSNYISTEPCQMINFDFHKDGYINAKDFAVLNRHIRGKDASIDENTSILTKTVW